MPEPQRLLSPTILENCERCTTEERRAIVAYCCHLTFSDKSVRRLEVDFVEALADRMQISADDVGKMARKARRRRLKIKTPTSRPARNLLFHLAMRTAIADTETDARERSALDRLAKQLHISPEIVDRELQQLHRKCVLPPETSSSPAMKPTNKQDKSLHGKPGVIESLTQDMVTENLRAHLTCNKLASTSQKTGELIYTMTDDGEIELELDGTGFDLPGRETFSVIIDGKQVCEIVSPLSQHTQPIKVKQQTGPQKFTTGDSVVIQHRDSPLLSGTLEPNGW